MKHPVLKHPVQGRVRRCGEFVGWAAAGLVIVATASFALAAMMADLL